jgi:Phosphopantetheine attachment site
VAIETTSTREFLRGVWAEALGHRDFGDQDDFFDVGGDSLAVEKMADLITRGTAIELPLETYFDKATIEDQAEELDARRAPRPR